MRISATLTILAATACATVNAWTANGQFSRQDMLKTMGGVAAGWMLSTAPSNADTLPGGVIYEVVKKGNGVFPDKGELVAIRFSAQTGDNKFDDIFDSPEPYYTRLGSGGLIKGVETTLPLMRVGDRWKLTVPVRTAK
jgi:FKBP-type peptidyl-prolyl cis-trans isomerase